MFTRKGNSFNRSKGSDKRKKTRNKYGKNTTRGLRIKHTQQIVNKIKNEQKKLITINKN